MLSRCPSTLSADSLFTPPFKGLSSDQSFEKSISKSRVWVSRARGICNYRDCKSVNGKEIAELRSIRSQSRLTHSRSLLLHVLAVTVRTAGSEPLHYTPSSRAPRGKRVRKGRVREPSRPTPAGELHPGAPVSRAPRCSGIRGAGGHGTGKPSPPTSGRSRTPAGPEPGVPKRPTPVVVYSVIVSPGVMQYRQPWRCSKCHYTTGAYVMWQGKDMEFRIRQDRVSIIFCY